MPYRRILLSAKELDNIVSRLGRELSSTLRAGDNYMALVVLEGARTFANDLLTQISIPLEVEYIKASSYSGTNSTGTVTIDKGSALEQKVCGRNILLIDDIYDTGLTLSRILQSLKRYRPQSIKTCVLLEKEVEHATKIDIDFIGTTIENAFAIGYGLDFNGLYRNLPCIGVLSDELVGEGETTHNP